MTRRYERGSVVGFVLIGVLLTAALVGGVWFARHPIGGSSTQTASDSNSTKDTSNSEKKDTSSASTDSTKATTDEELKETLAQQAAKSSSQQSTSTTTNTSSTPTSSSKLPVTGPADTVFEMIGAAMLSGTAVAYIHSRSVA